MAMPKYEIERHLYNGQNKNYSHMIVICDRWDYTDFVVYVSNDEDLEAVLSQYQGIASLYQVIEIYSYEMDLNYQLSEDRAWHKDNQKQINKDKNPKKERIVKLFDFKSSFSRGQVNINFPELIPFGNIVKLPKDMNGYIDKNGIFYPAITIASTEYAYGNYQNISMEQFAEAFICCCLKDQNLLDVYQQMIAECKNGIDILNMSDSFLVNILGFVKFYRYINDKTIKDSSRLPENYSLKQLIVLRQLFCINYSNNKDILDKDNQYSIKLARMRENI